LSTLIAGKEVHQKSSWLIVLSQILFIFKSYLIN